MALLKTVCRELKEHGYNTTKLRKENLLAEGVLFVLVNPFLDAGNDIGINLMLNPAGIFFALIFWQACDFLQKDCE